MIQLIILKLIVVLFVNLIVFQNMTLLNDSTHEVFFVLILTSERIQRVLKAVKNISALPIVNVCANIY